MIRLVIEGNSVYEVDEDWERTYGRRNDREGNGKREKTENSTDRKPAEKDKH